MEPIINEIYSPVTEKPSQLPQVSLINRVTNDENDSREKTNRTFTEMDQSLQLETVSSVEISLNKNSVQSVHNF